MRMRFRHSISLSILAVLLVAGAGEAPAAVTMTQVANGLSGPTAVAAPNDGSGRLFVVENQSGTGRVRVIDGSGNLLATPYYSHAITGGPWGEQGMLGLAFDPDFAANGTLYLSFTAPGSDPQLGAEPDQVLLRLVAANPAANVFSGSSEDVLRLPDPYWNHNGGNIMFGPDGYLYWGMGDGGSGGDPNGFSQNLWKKTVGGKSYYLLGKMLRLDVRNPVAAAPANQCGATPGQAARYSIPPDNPYAGEAQKCGEIWLHGLRNPWRWSFDRLTGDLVIGDVGQNLYEEVDFRAFGDPGNRNYGWNSCEGNHHYSPAAPGANCPAATGTVKPVIEYAQGPGCAVVGGHVYRGPVGELRGKYLFSDECASNVHVADVDPLASPWTWSTLAGTPSINLSSFGEDALGNLLAVDLGGGIYRFDGPSGSTHVMTPASNAGGSIWPGLPLVVAHGEAVTLHLMPAPGFSVASASGCGGSLGGNQYVTAPLTTNCSVNVDFQPVNDVIFADDFES